MHSGVGRAVIGIPALLPAVVAGPAPRADAVGGAGVDVHTDITYCVPDTPTVNGNKLDLSSAPAVEAASMKATSRRRRGRASSASSTSP
jgi:hypothetical protein